MSLSEKSDFCPSENICFIKWSQISRQYLAKNAFVPAPNMIFTLKESGIYQRNLIHFVLSFLNVSNVSFFPI